MTQGVQADYGLAYGSEGGVIGPAGSIRVGSNAQDRKPLESVRGSTF